MTAENANAYDVLDLKALRCFWAVAKHGSLTRAGIELGISESAVSQRVKSLEAYLGAKLYESPGGRVRLTTAGGRMMEMAVALFEQIEDFQRELVGDEATTEITLAAQDTILRYLLPGIVQRFTQQRPNVRLRLITRSVEETIQLVRQGDVDLGMTSNVAMPESISFHPFRTFQAYLILPKGHALVRDGIPAMETLMDRDTISKYPLIATDREEPAYVRISEALARQGLPYNVAFEVGTIETVKHYVELGLGVAAVSGICILREDRQRMEVLEIPERYGGATTYGVVVRRDKHVAGPLQELLALLGVVR